jgi:hypothetical protein
MGDETMTDTTTTPARTIRYARYSVRLTAWANREYRAGHLTQAEYRMATGTGPRVQVDADSLPIGGEMASHMEETRFRLSLNGGPTEADADRSGFPGSEWL